MTPLVDEEAFETHSSIRVDSVTEVGHRAIRQVVGVLLAIAGRPIVRSPEHHHIAEAAWAPFPFPWRHQADQVWRFFPLKDVPLLQLEVGDLDNYTHHALGSWEVHSFEDTFQEAPD